MTGGALRASRVGHKVRRPRTPGHEKATHPHLWQPSLIMGSSSITGGLLIRDRPCSRSSRGGPATNEQPGWPRGSTFRRGCIEIIGRNDSQTSVPSRKSRVCGCRRFAGRSFFANLFELGDSRCLGGRPLRRPQSHPYIVPVRTYRQAYPLSRCKHHAYQSECSHRVFILCIGSDHGTIDLAPTDVQDHEWLGVVGEMKRREAPAKGGRTP